MSHNRETLTVGVGEDKGGGGLSFPALCGGWAHTWGEKMMNKGNETREMDRGAGMLYTLFSSSFSVLSNNFGGGHALSIT